MAEGDLSNPYIPVDEIPADDEFSVDRYGDIPVLHTPVILDIKKYENFKEAVVKQLVDDKNDQLIIDMRDALEVDSTTLGVLLGALKRAEGLKKHLMLGGPLPPKLEELLRQNPMAEHIEVVNMFEPASSDQ